MANKNTQQTCVRCGDLNSNFYLPEIPLCLSCMKRFQGESSTYVARAGSLNTTQRLAYFFKLAFALISVLASMLLIDRLFRAGAAATRWGIPPAVCLVFACSWLAWKQSRQFVHDNLDFAPKAKLFLEQHALTSAFGKIDWHLSHAFFVYAAYTTATLPVAAAYGMLLRCPSGLIFVNENNQWFTILWSSISNVKATTLPAHQLIATPREFLDIELKDSPLHESRKVFINLCSSTSLQENQQSMQILLNEIQNKLIP